MPNGAILLFRRMHLWYCGLRGGYLNSPRLGSGAYLRFMPYFREITEDIAVSPALLNLEMLSVTAKSFNGGTFLSEITTLTNIPSPIFCLRPAYLRIFF